jgi:hypothetical protein
MINSAIRRNQGGVCLEGPFIPDFEAKITEFHPSRPVSGIALEKLAWGADPNRP